MVFASYLFLILLNYARLPTFENLYLNLQRKLAARPQEGIKFTLDAMRTILRGIKLDLENKRCVSKEEGYLLAKQHNLTFIETSAKATINVDTAFLNTANIIYDKIKRNNYILPDNIKGIRIVNNNLTNITSSPPKIENKCCYFY